MSRNPDPGRRPSFRRPTVLIGTHATLLGRPAVTPAQAATVGMYGVDLDLRRAWYPPAVDELERLTTTRLRSAWLPAQYTGPLAEARSVQLRGFLTHAVNHSGLRTIVLPTPAALQADGVAIGRIARHIGELHPVRIAMAIDAGELLRRGGSHLDLVANMRRMAEEWDLDIALDLTADGIATWEAEAALMRLFPRLALVRMAPWREADGSQAQSPVATVAMRSVAMLADQAYGGLISVTPGSRSLKWLSWLSRPGVELAGAAREEILGAYDRVDQYQPRAHEPNPRS